MKTVCYFDHAATTCCCPEAVDALERFSADDYANPSSKHFMGKAAGAAIQEAREFFSDCFQVTPEQVIFTSSGTEADNLAICGVALKRLESSGSKLAESGPHQLIGTEIEHPAVIKSLESLRPLGFKVDFCPVTADAQPDLDVLENLVNSDTLLVSMMQVNNIVGALIPVEEVAAKLKKNYPQILFHTDAIQAFGKVPHPQGGSPVDMISISGHKIQGPKGIGALIVTQPDVIKEGRIRPLLWGGGQESGLRSGTPSPALISAFHRAAQKAVSNQKESFQKVLELRTFLRKELAACGLIDGPSSIMNWNSPDRSVPHIVSLCIPGFPIQSYTKILEEQGIILSVGSACSSGKSGPEPVLAAMKQPSTCSQSSLRISLSQCNTREEVTHLVRTMSQAAAHLQKLLA